jgi:hypothetical protein
MKTFTSICLFLCLISITSAQNIKKGYKTLEKQEYLKAIDDFNKVISSDRTNAGANFGLALIYSNAQFTGSDIIKSWEYCLVVKENMGSVSAEDLEIIGEYFANTEVRRSSRPPKKKMNMAIDDIEAMLIKYIREENNLELAIAVMEKFPEYRHYDNVVHIRNHLEYRKAEKLNTFDAYQTFINDFSDAAQIPKAIKNRNALAYNKAAQQNTIEAYNAYLADYPKSLQANKALINRNKLAFEAAKRENTIEALVNFIYAYPNALEFAQAKNLIKELVYKKAKEVRTLEAYNNFISQYPAGEMYIDIFNLKSAELGRKYLQSHTNIAAYTKWCRMFDNKERLDFAGSVIMDNAGNITLASNTTQNDSVDFTDAWLLALNSKGEMLWNKQLGSPVSDMVYDFKQDNEGNLYGVGYTNNVNDTTQGEAWVFKIDANGKKIWNRSIDAVVATSLVVNSSNQLIVTGYKAINDSTLKHFVLKLNGEGKKLWERSYIENYLAYDIDIASNDDMLITTNNWVYKLDQQGYILWENRLDSTYRAQYAAFDDETGVSYLAAIKDSIELVCISLSENGETVKQVSIGELSHGSVFDIELSDNAVLLSAPLISGTELTVMDKELNINKSFDILPEEYAYNPVNLSNNNQHILITSSLDDVLLLVLPSSAF